VSYLLDTNICIYIINARPKHVLERFRQVSIGDIGISSITAAELAFGVMKSCSERNRRALEMFFAPLELYPFDASANWHYGEIRRDLEQRGEPIGPLDTMIAAHARVLDAVLVTINSREFSRVPGLNIENWAE
jgi:tRNA(fMet)-specific endonuclease VapC